MALVVERWIVKSPLILSIRKRSRSEKGYPCDLDRPGEEGTTVILLILAKIIRGGKWECVIRVCSPNRERVCLRRVAQQETPRP